MTLAGRRTFIRVRNNWPIAVLAIVITAAGCYAVDRLASLGAHLARALL